jgi:hypothetical protein
VEDPRAVIPTGEGCPGVEIEEAWETWRGGCALSDGTIVEGSLLRYEGPEGTWLAGDGFAVRDGAGLIFFFDGAIELLGAGDLLAVDAAASLCGADGSCADGVAVVDLSFALYPMADFPWSYDVTVEGAVALDAGAPVAVDGTWSIDEATCAGEPASGLYAIRQGTQQALELDGGRACDSCAVWTVQGLEVGRYCGARL